MSNQSEKDYLANQEAIFHGWHVQEDGTEALPCIEIGGVQVYAYVRDGELHVSVDYDTADVSEDGPFAVYGQDQVPTVVSANGITVWDALPE